MPRSTLPLPRRAGVAFGGKAGSAERLQQWGGVGRPDPGSVTTTTIPVVPAAPQRRACQVAETPPDHDLVARARNLDRDPPEAAAWDPKGNLVRDPLRRAAVGRNHQVRLEIPVDPAPEEGRDRGRWVRFEKRPVDRPVEPAQQLVSLRRQRHDAVAGPDPAPVLLRKRRSTADRHHLALRLEGALEAVRLAAAKAGFALAGEDLGHRFAGPCRHLVVDLPKRPAQAAGEQRADGRFAAPHEADEHDVVHPGNPRR